MWKYSFRDNCKRRLNMRYYISKKKKKRKGNFQVDSNAELKKNIFTRQIERNVDRISHDLF